MMHFEQLFGEVHEVSFIRNFGSVIDRYLIAARKYRHFEIEEEKAIVLIEEGKKGNESYV
jgi:hypothetical protein